MAAKRQGDSTFGKIFTDSAGVGYRSGEPIQLRDHQGVTALHRRESFVQTWPFGVAPVSMVEKDSVLRYAKFAKSSPLLGDVIGVQ